MTAGAVRPAWPSLLLRLGIAAAFLALAFRAALPEGGGPLLDRLAAAWVAPAAVALAWMAVAAAVLGLSYAICTVRFHGLLAGAGMRPRYGTLLRAYLIAGFFNTVLPGAILGDVYRVWDIRTDSGRGSEALGLVVLERLLGLAALGAIFLVVAPFVPLEGGDVSVTSAVVGLALLILLGTAAVLWPAGNRLLRRMASLLEHVWARAADAAERALGAVGDVSEQPRVVAKAFGWSLLAQSAAVVAAIALAVPLDADVAPAWFAVIVPFVTLVAMVPISLGGAGVREYLYVTLFGAVGMRAEVALALSLSVFATSLVWSAVGFALFAAGRRRAP